MCPHFEKNSRISLKIRYLIEESFSDKSCRISKGHPGASVSHLDHDLDYDFEVQINLELIFRMEAINAGFRKSKQFYV